MGQGGGLSTLPGLKPVAAKGPINGLDLIPI